jgi:signal transduction histidine kinase
MTEGTEHQDSFQKHLDAVNLTRARFGYWLVALLMPAGVTLDWVTHGDWVGEFAFIRFGSSVVALTCLWLTYLGPWAERSIVLQTLPALIAAAGVEFMVIPLGAASSEYYAGLCLCIVALAVLHTWRWPRVLGLSAAIVTMWLVPALPEAIRGEAAWPLFYNNIYFLILTTAIAVPSTEMRYRAAKREFEAHEELATTSAELADALNRAQEVDRLKNEFFANISHELRTPLTLILSPVDELLGKLRPGPESDALKVVRRNAMRLLRMIDDLLDLARLEAGGLRLRIMQADVAKLAERAAGNAAPAAKAKGIEMSFSSEGVPPEMFGDAHRIEIVLTNLIGNAMKFTPRGGRIEVNVYHNPAGTSSR